MIEELKVALVVLGVAVVVAVWVYNRWLEKRFRSARRNESPKTAAPEVMGPRLEPSIYAEEEGKSEEALLSSLSALEPEEREQETFTNARLVEERKEGFPAAIDPAIDTIFVMDIMPPVSSLALQENLPRTGRWYAWTKGQEGQPLGWRPLDSLTAGDSVERVVGGLQLASRKGAVSRETLAIFLGEGKKLAEKLPCRSSFTEMDSALARARALDVLAQEVDMEVSFCLIPASGVPFAESKVRALAEVGDFRLDEDGIFRLRDDEGRVLVSLYPLDKPKFTRETLRTGFTSRLALSMDFALVPKGPRVFCDMVKMARSWRESLNAEIVDQEGRPLSEEGARKIQQALEVIARKMEAADLPAGGELAARLFS